MSSVSTEWRLPAPIHACSSIRVDADDLRHAVVSLLHSWWVPTPRCRRWLDNPFYRSYGVLTMCRMRYTLQYGVIVSKAMTARWAQAALDARWTPLIEAALAWSNDNVPDLGETRSDSSMAPGRRASVDGGGGWTAPQAIERREGGLPCADQRPEFLPFDAT